MVPQCPLRSATGMHAMGLWGTPLPHTPRIKLQALSKKPFSILRRVKLFNLVLTSNVAQSGVDWTEPGYGTQAYMDCTTSHSEEGAGDDEMVPCSPPWGANGGERRVASTLGTNIIARGRAIRSSTQFGGEP